MSTERNAEIHSIESDLTYQHLLAQGLSHCRLEMTDPDRIQPMPEVAISINESN